MRIDVLTLFPEMFTGILQSSIIKRALEKGVAEVYVHDYREYSSKKNKRVDDYSYGGGAGMIIEVQPIIDCLKAIPDYQSAKKIITLPAGRKYEQDVACEYSKFEHVIIICGHYEGIDYRILDYVDEAVSIGDYILTGGEIASLAMIDSIIRLLPEALGNKESSEQESFSDGLLEFPQYTRPEEYDGKRVPEVLLSGNHENIRKWRRFQSLKETYLKRPDLLKSAALTKEDEGFLIKIKAGEELWKR